MSENQPAEPEKEPEHLAVLRLQRRYNLVLGIAIIALVVSVCVAVMVWWG